MNMLAFDPIRAMTHDFLRVLQYFIIPTKLYKKSEAVDRLSRREAGEGQIKNKKLDKSQARRGGTLKGKLLQLSNIYSIDVCYNIETYH